LSEQEIAERDDAAEALVVGIIDNVEVINEVRLSSQSPTVFDSLTRCLVLQRDDKIGRHQATRHVRGIAK
jgi:hypothetical protein